MSVEHYWLAVESSCRMSLKRHLSYAQGYLELGLIAEAVAELEKVPPAERETPPVVALRMAVLHEQKDWRSLVDLAAAAAKRTPGEPAIWVTWAYAARRCDSLAAAERILLEAELHHPNDATIQFNLGCYACLRGDLAEAQRRVDRAVSLDSKFLQAAATDPDLEALRAKSPKRRRRRRAE